LYRDDVQALDQGGLRGVIGRNDDGVEAALSRQGDHGQDAGGVAYVAVQGKLAQEEQGRLSSMVSICTSSLATQSTPPSPGISALDTTPGALLHAIGFQTKLCLKSKCVLFSLPDQNSFILLLQVMRFVANLLLNLNWCCGAYAVASDGYSSGPPSRVGADLP